MARITSLTRDWTHAPVVEVQSLGHWTTKEVPKDQILKEENYLNKYSIKEGRPGNQGTKESGNQEKKENGQLDEEEGEGGEEEMMKMLVTSSNETKKQKAGLWLLLGNELLMCTTTWMDFDSII